MVTEINLPVRLQVIQDSISEFKKILDSLQPNTTGWKAMNKLITQMTAQAEKLQVQLSKPFSSQSQFNQTDKTIEKLEDAATRVQIVMDSLKFSDIKLTPAQTAEFEKFKKEIDDIGVEYNKLKEQIKQGFLNQGNNRNLIGGLDKKALEGDLESIQAAVDKHVSKLEDSVKKQNEAFNKLRSQVELGSRAKILTSTDQGLTREALGDKIFDKYLTGSGDSLKLKLGKGISKANLLKEIEEAFNLQPGDLNNLADKTIKQINEAFQKMGERGQINLLSGIIKNGREKEARQPLLTAEIEDLKEQIRIYKELQEELKQLQQSDALTTAQTVNNTHIAEINTQMNTLKNTILSNIATNESYKNSMSSMRSGFSQLRGDLQEVNAEFLKQQAAMQSFNSLKMTITNFMGFAQILNLTKQAISSAANHIKELDSVMNKISIVTDMSTSDLWAQVDLYSAMAQKYGASIKGAYEVSQIYYQQGLDTKDVLILTNETLKLAKISGMDYANTTDYMTTAIRGFKMEMSEASTVVDVYSNLASNTAVSQEELAVAMSKTASSLQSVGATFQEASAMIATMVAVTRESATNIGSALKSIASRYGELTKDPTALTDSEGDAMSFNKVDSALQSVGISMKTAEGQFREFTDVIVELGEKWNQLESTQQRYIATQFAGNRQQSRFLALVSNVDLLKENIENAENSEGIGDLQALKVLDSIENKIEQVKVAYQQFYTTIGAENVWKFFLDGIKNTINSLNGLPKLFNTLPLGAIAAVSLVIRGIKTLAINGLSQIVRTLQPVLSAADPTIQETGKKTGELWIKSIIEGTKALRSNATATGAEIGQYLNQGLLGTRSNSKYDLNQIRQWKSQITDSTDLKGRIDVSAEMGAGGYLSADGMTQFQLSNKQALQMLQAMEAQALLTGQRMMTLGNSVQMAGSAFSLLALTLNDGSKAGKTWAAAGTMIAGAVSLIGIAISTSAKVAASGVKTADNILKSIPWYATISAVVMLITGAVSVIRLLTHSLDDEIDDAVKHADELATKAKEAQSNLKSFEQAKKKVEELEKARYDSAEAAEEYQNAVDKLTESFPQLILNYNAAGDAVINLQNMESMLAEIRQKTAEATFAAAQAEIEANNLKAKKAKAELPKVNDPLGNFISDSKGSGKTFAYRNGTNERIGTSLFTWEEEGVVIQNFVSEIRKASQEQNIDKTLEIYNELVNYLNEQGLYMSEELQTVLMPVINKTREANSYYEENEILSKRMINSFLNGATGKQPAQVLQRSESLFNVVSESLYNEMATDGVEINSENLSKYYENLFGDLDETYGNLSDNQLKQLDKILDNTTGYTTSDVTSELEKYGIEVDDWLLELIQKKLSNNKEAVQGKLSQIKSQGIDTSAIDNIVNDENTEITLDERRLLNVGLDYASNLKKNGYDSSEFLTNFSQVYSQIAGLPAEVRNSLIQQLVNNGFTKEGITKTLQFIKSQNIDIDTTSLTAILEGIIPNIQLAIDSITGDINQKLKDIESFSSGLSSGISLSNLEDTLAMAQNLGVNLDKSDFIQDGNKLVLSYEKYKEVIGQLQEHYEEQLGIKTEEINTKAEALKKNYNDIDAARLIFGSEFEEYYEKDDKGNYALKQKYDNEEFKQNIDKAKEDANKAVQGYYDYLQLLADQLSKSADWKHGNYSSLETLGLENFTEGTAVERLREILRDPTQLTEEEAEQPDVINALKQYSQGWKSIISDLTSYGIEYVESHASLYEGVASDEISSMIDSLQAEGGLTVPEAIQNYGQFAKMSIEEINSAIVEWIDKNSNLGKANALSKLIISGFTKESLSSYISKNADDKDITSYIDEGGLKGPLADVYEWDEATNAFKLKRDAMITNVLEAWKEATGQELEEGSDLYLQVLQDWTQSKIDEAEKNDKFTSGISTLTGAKPGQRINVQGMDSRIMQALKAARVTIVEGYTNNITQAQINAAILAADAAAQNDNTLADWERNVIREAADKIRESTSIFKSLDSVMQARVSQNDAKNWAESLGISDVRTAMERIGYVFDENLGEYIMTADSIDQLEAEIDGLESADNNEEIQQRIAELRAKLADLKYATSEEGKKNSAIDAIISNTEKVSNESLAALQQAFSAETVEWTEADWGRYVTDNRNGTSTVDILSFLAEVGYNIDNIFAAEVASIKDNYMSGLSDASSLVSKGTTSFADMQGFKAAYSELIDSQEIEFEYDSILKGWTIDPSLLRGYYTALANKLELGDEEFINQWVDDQIQAMNVENIDFKSYFSGGMSQADLKQFEKGIETYVKTLSPDAQQEDIDQQVLDILDGLSDGGATAVEYVRSIMGDKFTPDMIELAYRNAVSPMIALADKLDTFQKGTFVDPTEVETLKAIGFEVDANNMITKTADLVEAYKALYNNMAATGDATRSELNALAAKVLNEPYKKAQSAIDAFNKGATMSIDEFIQLYEDAGQQFGYQKDESGKAYSAEELYKGVERRKDELINEGIISINDLGQIEILKFEQLATKLGWEVGSEQYKAGYSAWVDAKIADRDKNDLNKIAASQVSKFKEAKVGTELNVTQIRDLLGITDDTIDTITIATQEQLDGYIQLLEAKLQDTDWVSKNAEQAASAREVVIAWKESFNKFSGLQGIISEKVSMSSAKAYADALGKTGDITTFMQSLGFIWDDYTKQFIAGADAITHIQAKIDELRADTTTDHTEEINTLEASLNDLEYSIGIGKKNNAITNLLANYTNASEAVVGAAKTAFADSNIDWTSIISKNDDGTFSIDIDALQTALKAVGYSFTDAANQTVAQIGDTYASNITKASSMTISGTTSFADMESFGKQYKEVTGKVLSTDAFKYNDILDSWTLNPQIMEDFVRAQAQQLIDQGLLAQDEFESYVKDRTSEAIAEAIDFNAFFKASESDTKTAAKTREAIKNYYATSLTGLESIKKDDYIEEAKKFGVDEKYLDETAAQLAENARKRNEGKIKKAADASMANLKAGGQSAIDEMAKISGGIENLSTDEIEAAYRYQIQPLVEIGEKLGSLEKGSVISQDAAKILNTIDGFSVSAAGVVESVGNLQNAYQTVLNNMIATGNATVTDLNTLAKAQLNNKYKKNKTLSDTLSQGTISTDSLIDMYETATGKVFGAYESQRYNGSMRETYTAIDADKELQNWIKEGLVSVDKLGNVSIKNFSGVATKMGWEAGTKEYEDGYSAWVDAKIAENQKTKSKRAQAQISNLISGNVGDEINVSDLDASMKEALGITGDTYTILSEYQRDSMIMALDTATITKEATRKAVEEAQNEIKQKRNKNTGLQGIIAKNITKDNMKAFMDSIGYGNQTNIDDWAKAFGFEYDAWTDSFNATTNTIQHIRNQIALAKQPGSGATAEDIANLEILANQLEQELAVDPAKEALKDLLNNYTDATSQIAVFKAYFGDKVNVDQFVDTDVQGRQSVRIDELRTALSAAGYAYDDIFGEFIAKLTDEYINNAKKAGTLIAQGTTSYSEIDTFRTEFTKLTGSTFDIYYDSLLEGFTYDAEYLRQYVTAAADKIGFDSDEGKKQWIEDQIDAITVDNLDFSKVLSGNATDKEKATLTRDLENYFRTHTSGFMPYMGTLDEWVKNNVEGILTNISQGGQIAIDAMKSTGKELTTDEISAAYRTQIEPLASLAELLPSLEKGSVVAKNQIEALKTAGFGVNADGVVQSVGDLVAAYRGIYYQMKMTGEATVAELNSVVGKLLDNRDGEQQIIDALSSASSMTYSQLAEIYTNAGMELTEQMVNQMQFDGILQALGGNKVMIADFDKFAESMGWSAGSEEYSSALKTYRSSMVDYNNKISSEIKSEFEAVSNAKLGDKINISRTIQQYGEDLFKDLDLDIKDGILTISNTAQLPQVATRIAARAVQAGDMIEDELLNFIASIEDGIISGITSATDFSLNGTNSFASMQEFVNKYNQIFTDSQIDMSSFYYDTLFDTFKLDSSVLNKYIESQKAELKQYGLSDELIDTYIQDQTVKLAREAISVDDLLNANDINRGREAAKLSSAIQSYFDLIGGYQPLLDQIDYYTELEKTAPSTKAANMARKAAKKVQEELDNLPETITNALYQGGEEGVKWLKELKPEATSEEISSVYNASINRLRDAEEQLGKGVGETISGLAANIIRITTGFQYQEVGNGDIVIETVGDMVEAYNQLYQRMESNAQHTLADLNNLYAKTLTARDQKNIDLKDTLSSATGITYDAFASLMNSYGLNMQSVLNDYLTNGNIVSDGFGNLIISNFNDFVNYMNKQTGSEYWNLDNPALQSTYRSYIDAKAQLMNEPQETTKYITEQLSSILEAKPNEAINVYDLHLDTLLGDKTNAWLAQYGAAFEDGILKISNVTNVNALVQGIMQVMQEAGTLIPEELEAVTDAIIAALDNMISLLSKGIKGELSHTEALDIKKWYSEGIKQYQNAGFAQQLELKETADGLEFTQTSLANIYDLLKQIDSQKADQFLEDIVSTKESYKTLTGSLREFNDAREVEIKQTDTVQQAYKRFLASGFNGTATTNYNERPHIVNEDGSISTFNSLSASNAEGTTVLVTPILPDGTQLNEDIAAKYAEWFANDEIDLKTRIVDENGEQLAYNFEDIYMGIYKSQEEADEVAISLHEWHEAIQETNDALGKTSSMMQDIVQKAMVNPDAMNFMSNSLPNDMQSAVNAWENAAQAISTLTDAEKSGYIGVQDFYNIVHTASSLLESAGKEFNVAGMNAAQLMEAAANNVKIVDGKLKVDLSSSGMDITSGVGDMKQNMTDAMHELAQAEIDIIDAEIKVLEVLAAMEKLGEVDVDSNGISFEVSDVFGEDQNGIPQFTDSMQDYLASLKRMADTSTELGDALKNIKIQGKSLYDLLSGTAEEWTKIFGGKDNVSKFWQNLSTGLEGWDLEGNLQEQVLDWFKGLSTDLTVDLGDSGIFHVSTTGMTWVIDYNNEQIMKDAENAAKALKFDLNGKNIKDVIRDIVQNEGTSELTVEQNTILHVASGIITVVYDKNNKNQVAGYKVGGKTYTDKNVAAAVGDLIKAGARLDEDVNEKTTLATDQTIKGKIKIGKAEITVESGGKGVTYTDPKTKYTSTNIDDLYAKMFKNDQTASKDSIEETDLLEYRKWKVRQGITTEVIYEINNQESDINKNENLRNAVKQYLSDGKGGITYGDSGITLDLQNGITVTIPNDKLKFDSEENATTESIQQYLTEMMGIDLGLKDTISKGLIAAFEELGAIDTSNLSNIVTAMSELFSQGSALAGIPWETIAAGINSIFGSGSGSGNGAGGGAGSNPLDLFNSDNWSFEDIWGGIKAFFEEATAPELQYNGPLTVDPGEVTVESKELESAATEAGEKAGKSIGDGTAKGIEESESKISSAGQSLITNLVNTMSQAASSLAASLDWGILVSGLTEALDQLDYRAEEGTTSIQRHFEELERQVRQAIDAIVTAMSKVQTHISITWGIVGPDGTDLSQSGSGNENIIPLDTLELPIQVTVNDTGVAEAVDNILKECTSIFSITIMAIDKATSILTRIQNFKINDKSFNVNANDRSGMGNGGSGTQFGPTNMPKATGNFAMAQGTLMGELGPELVVSNGRYFVAGQNGAEFVNLSSDAIVFNHLQTEQLLKNGMSNTRGRVLTNERNAVSFATGNVNSGYAMASASAALAQLKALRAMWESLLGASVSDLAGAGGGGGGGGGDKIVDPRAWVDTVERWYNLTQLIARLEKEITHEQTLRTKLQSDFQKDGRAYYKSQKLSLGALKEQIAAQEELNLSRREYYDKRVEALKKSELGKIYTFDEEGQLKFRKDVNLNGYTDAMEFLTNLYGFNDLGKANYTNKEKYNLLQQLGFGNYMLYDSNGMEIKADSDNDGEITDEEWESYYEAATEAFRDKMDEYASATQSLWDQIQDGEVDLLELQNTANELLNEMRENQLDLEDKVLSAIEESRQRQIDDLQEERDALEESTGKFIDGLSDSLQKERDLYQNQEDKRELSRLKRQRDILARSGGTAAQISDLDNEIASKSQDMYFEMQQKQIDAIQEASDLEIERLDNQINIMTETLEYQKKYGLLWEAVYEKMDMSAAEITNFINTYSEEVWSKSPLATEQTINDTLFSAQQWEEFRDDVEIIRDLTLATSMAKDYETYDKAMKAEFGEGYDPTGKYKNKFTEVYKDTRDITKASEAARKLYHDDQKAKADEEARKRAEQARWAAMNAASSSGGGSSGGSSGSSSSSEQDKIIDGPKWVSDGASGCHQEVTWKKQGKLKGGTQAHNKVKSKSDGTKTYYKCSRCGYDMGFVYEGGAQGMSKESVNKALNNKKNGLATGGLVKARGIYELAEEGTEAVFNASQTKVLRDNILSNKPNSLISLLATYNQAYKDGVLPTTNNTQSLVIENATVNMNVSQISNDYDARRAGEQALEEIMRIARKTGATNSVRR